MNVRNENNNTNSSSGYNQAPQNSNLSGPRINYQDTLVVHNLTNDTVGTSIIDNDNVSNQAIANDGLHPVYDNELNLTENTCGLQQHEQHDELGENDEYLDKSIKRPRTTLTNKQRQLFRQTFEVTPKPCRKVSIRKHKKT